MSDSFFKFHETLDRLEPECEQLCGETFARLARIEEHNQRKVLRAFIDNGVSETHFIPTSGYGYGDRGRDCLDKVYAQVFSAEDALVRHNFVSGTHALTTALFGVLRTGDTMVSLTGAPYDTMEEVIGIRGEDTGSLKDFGIEYRQLNLKVDGTPDYEGMADAVKGAKIAYIQRSRGYALRESLHIRDIERIVQIVKKSNPDAAVVVDNCYGEFVEKLEPTDVGADLIVGSLIKNPGGSLAMTGGYIAGRRDLIEKCAYRLTSPGMGKEVGCTLGQNKNMFMGFFFAPHIVNQALKTAVFAACLFEKLGYEVFPKYDADRTDIIQALKIGNPDGLIRFCQGIQSASPVDAFVAPEPWDMPGYESEVIMAAGTFQAGASIELSADAPLREPYAVWMQGGINYISGKTGVLLAANRILTQEK
ncbi:aminotransferase class I/II-fold pyridoxal phosphate-dependent enzyme [Candidatus Soleaferrea massiliensis]|uniref:methionine gamma-lyase family protein n=1 Tax=Candidatus Soleaferrea massiliensis TaxID=1470354 RepID=UPI00069487C9|nr:methionine gamma-lyase family protein [Candidatus Soleaferrea massiliensis]